MADLYEIAYKFFQMATETDEGQKALRVTDINKAWYGGFQDFQFNITDGEPFYVTFQGGAESGSLSVHRGKTNRTDFWEVNVAEMDEATILDLFEGRIRPSAAIRSERWKDVSGQTVGKKPTLALITWLIRIGQDEVIKHKISDFDYWKRG